MREGSPPYSALWAPVQLSTLRKSITDSGMRASGYCEIDGTTTQQPIFCQCCPNIVYVFRWLVNVCSDDMDGTNTKTGTPRCFLILCLSSDGPLDTSAGYTSSCFRLSGDAYDTVVHEENLFRLGVVSVLVQYKTNPIQWRNSPRQT